jgi:hypothetical protein
MLEAKVKTSQANSWSIGSEWEAFAHPQRPEDRHSNLFVQLYRKMRLVRRLQNGDEQLEPDDLACKWRLGKNEVVRRAAEQLAQYCSKAWLVSLVPDTSSVVGEFFTTVPVAPPGGFPGWTHGNLGYLTWEELDAHCQENRDRWPNTLSNFEFNRGQIFGARALTSPPPPGCEVTWNSPQGPQVVVVKNRGVRNTRVRLRDGRTEKVPNHQLEW